MWKINTASVLLASSALKAKAQPSLGEVNNAGVARWMAEETSWGALTTSKDQFDTSEGEDLFAGVSPFAASLDDGRIFFYLIDEMTYPGSALTLSQASMTPGLFPVAGCGSMESAVDAQDPRCAKITYQGSIYPCSTEQSVGVDCDSIGREALFSKYPEMADYPDDHNFHVHELVLDSIWMIANFGGGGDVTAKEYYQASPEAHNIVGGSSVDSIEVPDQEIPAWDMYAARARWIVHHSLFTSISTRTDDETTFGNIRSITDGETLSKSKGLPNFYLPSVDPTAVDIQNDNKIVLTFSEAALAELVTDDGQTCAGQMAGMPTCAQLSLYGKAVPNEDSEVLEHFGSYHPLAPWLAQGGSHMGGSYYTVDIEKIVILDYFGGPHEVDVQDYLNYQFSSDGETAPNHDEYIHSNQDKSGMGGHDHDHDHGSGGDHSYGHQEGGSKYGNGGYGHGEGDMSGNGYGGYGHGEGHDGGDMSGHGYGGHQEGEGQQHGSYESQSSSSSGNVTQAQEGPSYIFLAVVAFIGSFLGSCARDKYSRRHERYTLDRKVIVSSDQTTQMEADRAIV